MKKRISFLLSIIMLMQLFVFLPVMAEETLVDTNVVSAVVGNSFIYDDETIGSVQVSDSTG